MKRLPWLVMLLAFSPLQLDGWTQPAHAGAPLATLTYVSPEDGGRFVPPGTTLALRLDGPIDPTTLSPSLFSLVGSVSGPHAGRAQLAADGATVVLTPAAAFAAGEQVAVNIRAGLATRTGAVFTGWHGGFSISPGGANPLAVVHARAEDELAAQGAVQPTTSAPAAAYAVAVQPQAYETFPHDFPTYTVTTPAAGSLTGSLFLAPFGPTASGRYLFIADEAGEPIFWKAPVGMAFDFTRQPDGTLTYYDGGDFHFHVLDNTYNEIKTIGAANGYTADLHDLQIMPNGDSLFLIYDPEIVDTTQIITSGGYTTATVVGLVIQELDPSGLPVFQWDSWSHFLITDTMVPLAGPIVDYVHGNAIERDYDGNLLLSSRHLSEITKIDRAGHILWRLGGKHNQFSFQNDPDGPFAFQHDVRRLPNGYITLFDNHNSGPFLTGPFSRAVEYQLDENAQVVTNTWQYRNVPEDASIAMGDNQRLPDGHRLIGWGFGVPGVTEVLTDSTKVFELTLQPNYQSYRAFRFPWSAVPSWSPTLVLTGTETPTLYYSWNGATDVASYDIYGGVGPAPNTRLGNQPRTGFEDHTALTDLPAGYCSFRVRPIDHSGQPQLFSNVVYTLPYCPGLFFPLIFR